VTKQNEFNFNREKMRCQRLAFILYILCECIERRPAEVRKIKVKGKHYRTIWISKDDDRVIQIIDQRHLPHKFVIEELENTDDFCTAIKEMHVRGAGLIGACAAYGMYSSALNAPKDDFQKAVEADAKKIIETRPTAINLSWAVQRVLEAMSKEESIKKKISTAKETAEKIADEDAEACKKIGEYGLQIIERIAKKKKGNPVNILTHCNAGWLAFVDHGTATAPIYAAHDKGIAVHVWVDETRPRNQGARLTAWELGEHGVPHTIIADNTGGHLMQHGMVDLVIVGSDRTTYTGDVANKIGTYQKALAAKDNDVLFFAALPSSSFDWNIEDGVKRIPIEERDPSEVDYVRGIEKAGAYDESPEIIEVRIAPKDSRSANYAFDVTPARLISGIITERGVMKADEESIMSFYPEKRRMNKETATNEEE
jgi:methylthioribose-1-phosphate isomerase